MAASIIVNGQNVTLRFEWTTTATIANNTAGAAAEELFNRGMGDHGADGDRLFSALNNQEKVNILYQYLQLTVNSLARDFAANKAAEAARLASIADSATNLHL